MTKLTVAFRNFANAFKISSFRPHRIFMCFVWIREQTAIISPYNINWQVFITETECVYCAVRTESMSVLSWKVMFGVSCSFRLVNCYFRGTRASGVSVDHWRGVLVQPLPYSEDSQSCCTGTGVRDWRWRWEGEWRGLLLERVNGLCCRHDFIDGI